LKVAFRQSFERDLRKVKDRDVLQRVMRVIERMEAANDISKAGDVTKLSRSGSYYRIRVGEYRIGVVLTAGEVEFVRCLHRRDLYRYFP